MRTHPPSGSPTPVGAPAASARRRRHRALSAAAVALAIAVPSATSVPAGARTVRKATGDFRVVISPDRRTAVAGSRVTYPIRLQTLRGFKLSNTTFEINAPDSVDAEIARVGKTSSNTYELDLIPAANLPTSSNVYRLTVTSNRVVRSAVLRLDIVGTTPAAPTPIPTAPPPTPVPSPVTTTTIAPSFTLRPLRTTATITTGETASFQVDVDRPTGYAGNVTFTLAGVPAGMNANFAPNPTTRGTVLYLTPTAAVPSGRYTILGTATAGSVIRTVQFVVDVRMLGDFTIVPNRTAVTLTTPGAATYTLTPTGVGGSSPSISYTVSGLPTGASAAFSANPSSTASTLTVTTTSATPNGVYNLTVTATSGTFVRSQILQLTVANAAPGFGLAALPDTINVTRGGAGVPIAVTVSTFGGFTGTVAIGSSGAPTGVTASTVIGSSTTATITVTAAGTAAAGTFNLAITGTSGSYAATVQVRVNVL